MMKKKIDLEPTIMSGDNDNGSIAPPNRTVTAPNGKQISIPKEIPDDVDVDVSTTVKYRKQAVTANPVKKPIEPANLALNYANMNNGGNGNGFSDNPIQEFIDEIGDDEDIYILLTRLMDSPLVNEGFRVRCSATTTYAPFPFNRMSFITDIQKINGNSGGRFKAIAVDAEMREIGVEMKTTSIGNPFIADADNANSNSQSDMAFVLKTINDNNAKLIEAMSKGNENKESLLEKLAMESFIKRVENIDKPNANPTTANTEETALMTLLKNPAVTKTAMSTLASGLSNMFGTPEKTDAAINAGKTILDRVMTAWENNPQLQEQTMNVIDKGMNLIGFGIASMKKGQKRPPSRNSNPQAQPPPERDTSEVDYTDAEIIEYEQEQEALRNNPLTKEILEYIDSDAPLELDNKFMVDAKAANPLMFKLQIAAIKACTFEEAYDLILNDYGFVEHLVLEVPRRLERLKEFHGLLTAG